MLNRRSTSVGHLREMAPPPRAPAGSLLFSYLFIIIFFFRRGAAGLARTGVEEGTRINELTNKRERNKRDSLYLS